MSAQPISFVELHDSRIASLCLQRGGQGVIEFSHIAVYHQVGEEECDVWSYRARLTMEGVEGVEGFELSGELAAADYDSKVRSLTRPDLASHASNLSKARASIELLLASPYRERP
jgi:hypothetical protein